MIEFQPWPKIARLNRDIVITEKIDGTNAAVIIQHALTGQAKWDIQTYAKSFGATVAEVHNGPEPEDIQTLYVAAQSRKRLITPEDDNFGFAGWVRDNAADLVRTLGEGRHFGEWWGSGIQRGYGLPKGEKRFSLFNTKRFGDFFGASPLPGLSAVPVLHEGYFSTDRIKYELDYLREDGSVASPGFDRPEGIVVYHTAANQMFKVTLENDAEPKSLKAVA